MTPKLEVAMLQAFHGLMLEALGTIALHDEQAAKTLGTKYREALAEQPAPVQQEAAVASGRYNVARIAWELERTAKGDGFHGNALRVAKDIPSITDEDRSLLDRFATGLNSGTDHVALQSLALRIDAAARIEPLAEQPVQTQAVEPVAQQAQPDRSECTADSDEECTHRACATNCPALAGRPAQPGDALFRQFLAEADKAGITHLKLEQPAESTDQAAEWMAMASSAVLALNDAASWLPDGQNKRTVALSAEHIQKRARALYSSTQQPLTLPPGRCASEWGGRATGLCLYTDDEVLGILSMHGITGSKESGQPGGIYTDLDSARLNWLNSNFFSDEKSDWDQRQTPNCHKWKFFAPNTVQGDIRRVIDVAILAEQIAANKNGGE